MPALIIPRNLTADASGDAARHDWIARLPATVGRLAREWELVVGQPYSPGGCCAWVAPAERADGERLVLKVAWVHDEALQEPDALRAWDGAGAVRLFAARREADTNAMLLERCVPGTMLRAAAPEQEQDVLVAGLLRRLWIEADPDQPFRPLAAMCEQWASAFEEQFDRRVSPLDPVIARDGIELLRELPKSASRSALLCTDLHAENILAAEREPWLAIDPKPYVGDPAYDVLQHMLNCPERLHRDPERLARRMARLTGIEPARVICWLFARCVQESLEFPELARVATRLGRHWVS